MGVTLIRNFCPGRKFFIEASHPSFRYRIIVLLSISTRHLSTGAPSGSSTVHVNVRLSGWESVCSIQGVPGHLLVKARKKTFGLGPTALTAVISTEDPRPTLRS